MRSPTSSAFIANKSITGRIKNQNGGQPEMDNNLILDDSGDLAEFFTDPLNVDFELADKKPCLDLVSPLKLGVDFHHAERKSIAPDLCPLDHTGPSTCDIWNVWEK